MTCDFCKFEASRLIFDDAHKSMNGANLYGYFCPECHKLNEAYWRMNGISLTAEMEIVMIGRTFNRYRKENSNV